LGFEFGHSDLFSWTVRGSGGRWAAMRGWGGSGRLRRSGGRSRLPARGHPP
jgi:hypothetical protein